MSGIEVVGLVLGAIPLVISGLQYYGEGIRTIKVIRNYSKEFADIKRRLEVEEMLFRSTIISLLSDCVDDERLNGLLDCEPDRLRIDSNRKGPFTDARSFREAFTRFKFGLRRSEYDDLMSVIERDNNALRKLTEQPVALEQLRITRGKRLPDFEGIRSRARSIFSALARGLRGSCQFAHQAHLCLKDMAEEDRRSTGSGRFRIVLHHSDMRGSISSDTQHLGIAQARACALEENEVRSLVQQSSSDAPDATLTRTAFAKRAVKFEIDVQSNVVATTVATSLNTSTAHSMEEIEDLCASIQRTRVQKLVQHGVCYG
ncbi:hypothetical protein EJ03DRAFT_351075 [Teratosphaeria nubilosa]|uniref:Uncharacterized protein n=1 Tax=Teratosphaeria nubilosa TaxID=161662 RepID=A0A6G1LAX2_9PEZI|nr:hypothetical protein EJ03DRAFT_351075 [Teratosphaeria nubilosa]